MIFDKVTFSMGGTPGYVKVRQFGSAIAWYEEKLGFKCMGTDQQEGINYRYAVLCPADEEDGSGFVLEENGGPGSSAGNVPVIFTNRLDKAHEMLERRGVVVGPVHDDGGGTRYFEFRDSEANVVEVCSES
jgi:predicted enzyme related to lactoylglutathione lyase